MQPKHVILGIHINDRIREVQFVQQAFTEYGCYIKTRIGLHHVDEQVCSPRGLILLEMFGDEASSTNWPTGFPRSKAWKSRRWSSTIPIDNRLQKGQTTMLNAQTSDRRGSTFPPSASARGSPADGCGAGPTTSNRSPPSMRPWTRGSISSIRPPCTATATASGSWARPSATAATGWCWPRSAA